MNFGLQSLVSDIAAAMFKVASVIGHSVLKSELENQAIYLAANPCPDTIFSAENLISLGREMGDIKPINALVLTRELESLRKSLSTIPEVPDTAKDDLDITPRFAKAGNSISDNHTKEKGRDNKSVRVSSEETRTNNPVKASRTNSVRKSSVNSDKVYQYISEHKEARLKELEAAFSEVSGRTVRRMTESLMKTGKIERIGNPGPTSFYRVTPKQSVGGQPLTTPKPSEDEQPISLPKPENIPQSSYPATPNVIAL